MRKSAPLNLRLAVNFLGDFFSENFKDSSGVNLEGTTGQSVRKKIFEILNQPPLLHDNDLDKIRQSIHFSIKYSSIREFNGKIQYVKERLLAGDTFCLPWGYVGPCGGHALFVEFEPVKSLSLLHDSPSSLSNYMLTYNVTIFNTGEGSDYHPISQKSDSYKRRPFIQYCNVPQTALLDTNFLKAIQSTVHKFPTFNIDKRLDNNEIIEIDDVYVGILHTLYPYLQTDDNFGIYQRIQVSGTCAVSCIWAYLIYRIVKSSESPRLGLERYKIVKETILIAILKEIFEVVKTINDPNELHLWRLVIEHSLSNIARHEIKFRSFQFKSYHKSSRERNQILQEGINCLSEMIKKIRLPIERPVPTIERPLDAEPVFWELCQKPDKKNKAYMMNGVETQILFLKIISDLKKDKDPYDALRQLHDLIQNPSVDFSNRLFDSYIIIASQFINELEFENLEKFEAKMPITLGSSSYYKTLVDIIFDIALFLTKISGMNPVVMLAIALLNYYGWRISCRWDEFLYVPFQFYPLPIETLRHQPHLMLKNFTLKIRSLEALLYLPLDSDNYNDDFSNETSRINTIMMSPKILGKVRKLKKIIDQSKNSQRSIIVVNTPYNDYKYEEKGMCEYADAYHNISEDPKMIFRFKDQFNQSYSRVKLSFEHQICHDDIKVCDFFVSMTPLMFQQFVDGTKIFPNLTNLDESPYANFRRLNLMTAITLSDHEREELEQSILYMESDYRNCANTHEKLSISEILQDDQHTPSIAGNSIYSNNDPSYSSLYDTTEAHNENENEAIIYNSLNSNIKHYTDMSDDLMNWTKLWNMVEERKLQLENHNDCLAIFTSGFAAGTLASILDASNWPFGALKYAKQVLTSIYESSFQKYKESWLKNGILIEKLADQASMAIYMRANILSLSARECSEFTELSPFYHSYLKEMKHLLEIIENMIMDFTKIKYSKAIGLLHGACLAILDHENGTTDVEKFKQLLRHYIGFKSYIGLEVYKLKNVLNQADDLYRTSLVWFIHSCGESWIFDLCELMNNLPQYTGFIKKDMIWTIDADFKTLFVGKHEDHTIYFDIINGCFWDELWETKYISSSKDFIIPDRFKPLLTSYGDCCVVSGNSLIVTLEKESIEIHVLHQVEDALLKYKEREYFYVDEIPASGFRDQMIFKFIGNMIYESVESMARYHLWASNEFFIVMDYKFRLIGQVEVAKNIGMPMVPVQSWYLWEKDRNKRLDVVKVARLTDWWFGENFVSRNISESCIFPLETTPAVSSLELLDGTLAIVVPSYRFNVSDPMTLLVIRQINVESKKSNSTGLIIVGETEDYAVDLEQSMKIKGSYIDHDFIICLDQFGNSFALVPLDLCTSFNPTGISAKDRANKDGFLTVKQQGKNSKLFKEQPVRRSISKIELIPMSSKTRELQPQTRSHMIFCAYYCLGKQIYPESIYFLRKVNLASKLTDEELILLDLFSKMWPLTEDSFPEAIALRIYAVYLIFKNSKIFVASDSPNSTSINPIQNQEKSKSTVKVGRKYFDSDLERYFAIENNLTPRFKILSTGKGSDAILSFEETVHFLLHLQPQLSTVRPFTSFFLDKRLGIAESTISIEENEGYWPFNECDDNDSKSEYDSRAESVYDFDSESESKTIQRQWQQPKIEWNILRPPSFVLKYDRSDFLSSQNTFETVKAILGHGKVPKYMKKLYFHLMIKFTDHIIDMAEKKEFYTSTKQLTDSLTTEDVNVWRIAMANCYLKDWIYTEEGFYNNLRSSQIFNSILKKIWTRKKLPYHRVSYRMKFQSPVDFEMSKQSSLNLFESEVNDQLPPISMKDFQDLQILLTDEKSFANLWIKEFAIEESRGRYLVPLDDLFVKFKDSSFDSKHSEFLKKLESASKKTNLVLKTESLSESIRSLTTKIEQKILLHEININLFSSQIKSLLNNETKLIKFSKTITDHEMDCLPGVEEIAFVIAKKSRKHIRVMFPSVPKGNEWDLYKLLIRLIFHYTGKQHFNRLKTVIEDGSYNANILVPIQSIRDERWILDSWIMAFESASNMRLRPEQIGDLIKMKTLTLDQNVFPNIIIQRLMAYGKTMILGTCLALAKADGYHLSIIIPPTSLFETNAIEMCERSIRFFSQNSTIIKYCRQENLEKEAESLVFILMTLKKTIVQREFVIMSLETIQSLINRWIMLRQNTLNCEDYEEKILLERNLEFLEQILKIFRERGSPLFDEIDSAFDPFKDLSFPVKNESRVNDMVKNMIIHTIEAIAGDIELINQGLDICNNKQFYLKDYESIKPAIAEHVIQFLKKQNFEYADPSLLSSFLVDSQNFNVSQSFAQLIDSTTGSSETAAQAKELLSAAYFFVNKWLKTDLKSECNVSMGRSKDPEYKLARPFAAANTPKEFSEFSDKWKVITMTCLMFANLGLNESQVEEWIAILCNPQLDQCPNDDIEFVQQNSIFIDQKADFKNRSSMENARRNILELAREVLKDESWTSIHQFHDIKRADLKKLRQTLANSHDSKTLRVVFDYVRAVVLENYSTYDEQVFSTALDTCLLFKTHQGYSGTIPNTYIFDEKIYGTGTIDHDSEVIGEVACALVKAFKGNESFIFELQEADSNLAEREKLEIMDKLKAFFKNLQSIDECKVNWDQYTSLIDIGAQFKDYPIVIIADAILEHFGKGKRAIPIEAVIFFDEASNNMMCMRRGELPYILPPITRGIIDMDKFTRSTIESRFIIYDQRHISGVDIHQPMDTGRALVTLNVGNTTRDIFQGVFRMRKILEKQRVDFCIGESFSKVIKFSLPGLISDLKLETIEKLDIAHIFLMAEYYQYLRETDENLTVSFQKVDSALKNHVIIGGILQEEGHEETFKRAYFQSVFVRRSKDEFYSRLISPKRSITVALALESYRTNLSLLLEHDRRQLFLVETESLVSNCPVRDEIVHLMANEPFRNGTLAIVEMHQENEVEELMDREMDVENEINSKMNNLHKHIGISIEELIILDKKKVLRLKDAVGLDDRLEYKYTNMGASFFSSEIFVTVNFINTLRVKDYPNVRDQYRKTPFLICILHNASGINSIIISDHDYLDIRDEIDSRLNNVSIYAPNGVCLERWNSEVSSGGHTTPKNVLEKSCELIETANLHFAQIMLFSGNIEMLSRLHYFRHLLLKYIIASRLDQFRAFINDPGNVWTLPNSELFTKSIFHRLL